jgi:hypothetical protein
VSLWTPDGEHAIDEEDAAEVEAQLAATQSQILQAPVDQVVANHVMGMFELAALHLRVEDPDLDAAKLPIDAMGLLVDNLGDRLADHDTLVAALTQLRMAYVQVKKDVEAAEAVMATDSTEDDPSDAEEETSGPDEDTITESDFLN